MGRGNNLIEIETFRTRKIMKREKLIRTTNGWRPLHTDFVDNNESDGYRVTFVNGLDDSSNSDEAKENQSKQRLRDLLIQTIENDTITFSDLKILMRLERGLELQQSTIDKLIIVRQGGLSGIIQRIKNLFNL